MARLQHKAKKNKGNRGNRRVVAEKTKEGGETEKKSVEESNQATLRSLREKVAAHEHHEKRALADATVTVGTFFKMTIFSLRELLRLQDPSAAEKCTVIVLEDATSAFMQKEHTMDSFRVESATAGFAVASTFELYGGDPNRCRIFLKGTIKTLEEDQDKRLKEKAELYRLEMLEKEKMEKERKKLMEAMEKAEREKEKKERNKKKNKKSASTTNDGFGDDRVPSQDDSPDTNPAPSIGHLSRVSSSTAVSSDDQPVNDDVSSITDNSGVDGTTEKKEGGGETEKKCVKVIDKWEVVVYLRGNIFHLRRMQDLGVPTKAAERKAAIDRLESATIDVEKMGHSASSLIEDLKKASVALSKALEACEVPIPDGMKIAHDFMAACDKIYNDILEFSQKKQKEAMEQEEKANEKKERNKMSDSATTNNDSGDDRVPPQDDSPDTICQLSRVSSSTAVSSNEQPPKDVVSSIMSNENWTLFCRVYSRRSK